MSKTILNPAFIKVEQFCILYSLQRSIFDTFRSYELIQVDIVEKEEYLNEKEYRRAKQVIRLYQDLGINPEGIDVIQNLLKRIKKQEKQIILLKNQIRIYID